MLSAPLRRALRTAGLLTTRVLAMRVFATSVLATSVFVTSVFATSFSARRVAAQPAVAAPQRHADGLAGFEAYVEQARRDWQVPGLAVGVVSHDSVVLLRGYGVRTLGATDSVGVHTLFANASTTKAFTAAVAATLVDEGRLHWEDRVADRLPGFALRDPWVTRELTLRDLLTHQLGFGDPQYLWYLHPSDSLAVLLPRLRLIPAQTSFRSRFAYNNVGYALAGAIDAAAGRAPWDTLVRRRLLDPLGMRDTRTRGAALTGATDVAHAHDLVRDTLRVLPEWTRRLVDGVAPAGSMYSSVSDMTRWIRFLLDSARTPADAPGGRRRLISDTAFRALFSPQTLVPLPEFYPTAYLTQPTFMAYGYGWFLQDYAGETVIYHTGSIDGTVALVALVPARQLGFVIFANRDHAELRHALLWRLLDGYRAAAGKGTVRDWSTELRTLYARADSVRRATTAEQARRQVRDPRPPLPLARYTGVYSDSLYGTVAVVLDSARKQLELHFAPEVVADLRPTGGETFRAVWRTGWMGEDVVRFGPGELRIGESGGRYARMAGAAIDTGARSR